MAALLHAAFSDMNNYSVTVPNMAISQMRAKKPFQFNLERKTCHASPMMMNRRRSPLRPPIISLWKKNNADFFIFQIFGGCNKISWETVIIHNFVLIFNCSASEHVLSLPMKLTVSVWFLTESRSFTPWWTRFIPASARQPECRPDPSRT